MHRRSFYRKEAREAYAARFASELAGVLYDLGITHRELAQALGVTHHTVDSWTRVADPKLPGQRNLLSLCALLDAKREGAGQKVAKAAGISNAQLSPSHRTLEHTHPIALAEQGGATLLGSAEPAPGNIPAPFSEFVGRRSELEQVRRLLGETRLLTLTGTGGVGKTRLALQVASRFTVADFPDGVWLVELDAISDPELIPPAIAGATGMRPGGTRPLGRGPLEELTAYIGDKRLLILLDNCEHLIETCASLAERMVQECQQLRILATSREALDCDGESAWLVPPLSVPDVSVPNSAGTEPDMESYAKGKSGSAGLAEKSGSCTEESESEQLFVARARERQPDFQVTSRDAAYLAQICRRLDGIPLALELAAARVMGMTLEEIATRLDASLHLLTRGRRTGLPRHQALQASLDWSHDLLAPPEQMLFRRLAVFVGGWTLNAAEAICAGGGLSTYGVLGNLMQLVSKSLVVAEQRAEGTRYHFHETVRQYALEKLEAQSLGGDEEGEGEKEALQRRHALYFSLLVESSSPHVSLVRRAEWNDMVVRESDNVRAALAWALPESRDERPELPLDPERSEVGLRLAGTLYAFWSSRGEIKEGLGWLERALHQSDPARRTATRARALFAAGALLEQQGQIARVDQVSSPLMKAQRWLEESEAIWREHRDKRNLADTLMALGAIQFRLGNFKTSQALLAESLALAKETGNAFVHFFALFMWGDFELEKGNLEIAQERLQESLEVANSLEDKGLSTLPLCTLGRIAWLKGDYEAGQALVAEALRIRIAIGDQWYGIAGAQAGLAEIMRSPGNRGDLEQASALAEKSLQAYRKFGDSSNAAWVIYTLGHIASASGDNERAITLWRESLALSKTLGKTLDTVLCLAALAGACYSAGRTEQAATLFGFVDSVLDKRRLPWPPGDREDYERGRTGTKVALGNEAFAQAWKTGSRMTPDEAAEYILSGRST